MLLVAVFSGAALLLTSLGIYGVMACAVARRVGEIGIRLALGAQRGDIARDVLRRAAFLGGTGAAIGVPVALALAQLIKSQLYGVAPSDPAAIACGGLVLMGITLLSAWIPARRAANVDPLAAMRNE